MQIDPNSQIIHYDDRPVFNFRNSNPNASEIIVTNQTGLRPLTFMGKFIPHVQIEADQAELQALLIADSHPSTTDYEINQHHQIYQVITEALSTSELYIKLRTNQVKLSDLNARERTVVMMAAEGVPNKTIARRLNVSVKTIEHCRRKAYSKLDVTCSAEVASLVTFGRFFAALDANASS